MILEGLYNALKVKGIIGKAIIYVQKIASAAGLTVL
jgi:hypothetical protein